MTAAPFVALAAAAVLLFAGPGCIVTSATYEMKAKEADSLREAMASLSREKGKLAEENADLRKQVAAGKEAEAELSARLAEREESLKRYSDDLAAARQMYEGSRERFIEELLEKEKETGSRVRELAERAERDEAELARLGRERDILVGRVERLREEREEAAVRRDERLANLAVGLEGLSRDVSVYPMGPALRVSVPEKLIVRDRGRKLTDLGTALVSRIAGAAADSPSSALIVVAGEKASADLLRKAAASEKVPENRLFSHVREKALRAELLLVAP